MKKFIGLSVLAIALFTAPAHSKVYQDAPVGKYKASYDLNAYTGGTLLSFMKTVVFPALNATAPKPIAKEDTDAIAKGQGVEVRLSKDVSTYHVRYKAYGEEKAERSGRSFSAVGTGPRVAYLADASYSKYLTSLDKFSKGSKEQLVLFYTAVIKILANSDASAVAKLNEEGKEVLADFVAVYIAEQYRHMIGGDGEGDLGEGHNWDDAHLQVTLLAAFHAGQKPKFEGMFYEGSFTNEVFDQINKIGRDSAGKPINACVYKQGRIAQFKAIRAKLQKRTIDLTDYWQFNKECKRSGVNMTRGDFSKMGTEITDALATGRPAVVKAVRKFVGAKAPNVISGVAELFINDDAPDSYPAATVNAMTKAIVDFVMQSNVDAHEITLELAK